MPAAAALQIITFARSLSARTWLGVIALLAVVAGLVTYGEHREAGRIASVARVDTIKRDLVALKLAQSAQDSAVVQLTAARPATIATGIARTKARSAVIQSPGDIPRHGANQRPRVTRRPEAIERSDVILSGAKDIQLVCIDTLPAAIITLLDADDAKIAADSIYIASTEVLLHSIMAVESAHAMLDTILIHPAGMPSRPRLGLPDRHYALVGILGIGARLSYNFLRHRRLLP